jgi:nicotinate-nucleotide pyrophosphorylase
MSAFTPDETAACRRLIDLALAEDLGTTGDRTSLATIPAATQSRAAFVARSAGVVGRSDQQAEGEAEEAEQVNHSNSRGASWMRCEPYSRGRG